MKLYDLVAEAYRNAIDNDYDLSEWTIDEVALDMWTFDADIAEFHIQEIADAVREYREKNK